MASITPPPSSPALEVDPEGSQLNALTRMPAPTPRKMVKSTAHGQLAGTRQDDLAMTKFMNYLGTKV